MGATMPDSTTGDGGARYFANIRQTGPLKYRDVLGSIGVLESPDNAMPIGQADCAMWDEKGLAVWNVNIGGQKIEGRWLIIDREFKRMQ
jgi:hypothetical protein